MRSTFLVLLCLFALGIGGCGSLQVKVDILDRDYVTGIADQRGLLKSLLLVVDDPQDTFQAQQITKIKNDVISAYQRLPDLLAKLAADPKANATQTKTLKGLAEDWRLEIPKVTKRVEDKYASFLAMLIGQNAAIRANFNALNGEEKVAVRSGKELVPMPLRQLLAARDETLRSVDAFGRETYAQLDTPIVNASKLLAASALADALKDVRIKNQHDQVTASADVRSLTGGNVITGDANASLVARADEKHWSPVYNKAFANGMLGNVDIAIKMDSVGDFTVKGVSFDPSQVAQVVSKVTSQALVVATQIAGVPVLTTAPSGDGAALAKSSARLADLNKQRVDAEAEARETRATLIDIGLAVVRERGTLALQDSSSNNALRLTALSAIRTTYDSQKARINTTPADH